eukprot:gb/GEZJ01004917.1/.p3 GENE.gb/GEZJ01004917.1/~~gb/GEZJ01004917.1/.p3  ORF type:complete len:100 (-),score=13.49 gb/GEZJ01004917.1/:317-616(-)
MNRRTHVIRRESRCAERGVVDKNGALGTWSKVAIEERESIGKGFEKILDWTRWKSVTLVCVPCSCIGSTRDSRGSDGPKVKRFHLDNRDRRIEEQDKNA